MKFRRNRRNTATGRRRAATAPVPQPTRAAPAPADLYTGGYQYDPQVIPDLREHAQWCRKQAATKERQANQLLGDAARDRVHAADYDRIAVLAEHDATTPPDAAWPVPAPQPPQPAAPVVHFSDQVGFWPPCGARTEATWQTVNPAEVTCEACRAHLAGLAQSSPGAEPRAAWSPLPSQDGDTLTFAQIEAQR